MPPFCVLGSVALQRAMTVCVQVLSIWVFTRCVLPNAQSCACVASAFQANWQRVIFLVPARLSS
jgi:hypothetical protein